MNLMKSVSPPSRGIAVFGRHGSSLPNTSTPPRPPRPGRCYFISRRGGRSPCCSLGRPCRSLGPLLLKTGLLLALRLLMFPRLMPLSQPARERLVREDDRVRGALPGGACGRALTSTPRGMERLCGRTNEGSRHRLQNLEGILQFVAVREE